MTVDDLRQAAAQPQPPAELEGAVLALWHDARGDWHAAHEAAQEAADPTGAWVHAYLHRKEGDLANAGYWYRIAGQPVATGDIDAEWAEIARALLTD